MRTPMQKITPQNVRMLVTSGFRTPSRPTHNGVDLAGWGIWVGDPVNTVKGGIVVTARFDSQAGKFVRIDHGGGIHTRYLHMDRLDVFPNQWVDAGDVIGSFGNTGASTGPHLHFEIIFNTKKVGSQYEGEPQDPVPYIAGEKHLPTLLDDGVEVVMPVKLENGRTWLGLKSQNGMQWVEVRYFAERMGYTIGWDPTTGITTITKRRN